MQLKFTGMRAICLAEVVDLEVLKVSIYLLISK